MMPHIIAVPFVIRSLQCLTVMTAAVVTTAVMTVIAAVGILVRDSVASASILADAVYNASAVPGTGFVLVAGRAAADASVLTDAVHITGIVAGAVAVRIAGCIGRGRCRIRRLGRRFRLFCGHSCRSIADF